MEKRRLALKKTDLRQRAFKPLFISFSVLSVSIFIMCFWSKDQLKTEYIVVPCFSFIFLQDDLRIKKSALVKIKMQV
jgi:hypothetical protein